MSAKRPPEILNQRYRLTRQLGKGGMAWVFLATDEMLSREVAIKFLPPESIQENASLGERFIREARAVAKLSHPNIVTLFDVGVQDEWHYQVLEFIAGDTLHHLIQEEFELLTLKDKIEITRSVLTALAHAHEQGLVHRDIKPENILMTPENHVKVADFGLALAREDDRLTEAESMVGTALYMAPEMTSGEAVDHRVDLYAVGAVLYELLTGQTPYSGYTPMIILARAMQDPLTPPTMLNPGIPESLEQFVITLLEKDPENRYPSARKALENLPESDQLDSMMESELAQSTLEQLSRPLLERLVRSSSTHHRRGLAQTVADDSTLQTEEVSEETLAPDVFLYAAQGDLVEAIEEERRTMARMLQEEVINHMTMLMTQLGAYEQTLTSPQGAMAINVLSALVRQIMQQARDLGERLRPEALETLGLEAALKMLSDQEMRTRRLTVSLAMAKLEKRLPMHIELTLLRSAQAAIDRAVTQSYADQIFITLQHKSDMIQLQIDDNGWLPEPGPVILPSIRQRVQGIGGTLDIRQGSKGGLSVAVRFEVLPAINMTEREQEVISLLAEGLSNKEIAALLFISPRTVKFHLDNIFSKLGVNTRTEAAIFALKNGWVRKNTTADQS